MRNLRVVRGLSPHNLLHCLGSAGLSPMCSPSVVGSFYRVTASDGVINEALTSVGWEEGHTHCLLTLALEPWGPQEGGWVEVTADKTTGVFR